MRLKRTYNENNSHEPLESLHSGELAGDFGLEYVT